MYIKRQLRSEIRQRILGFENEYISLSDEGIFNNLMELEEVLRCKRVFCYYSIGREVDTRKIINRLLDLGKELYLPKIISETIMEAVFVSNLSCLREGRLTIPEPTDGKRLISCLEDVAIVPALSFDEAGYRLGQGGGYYDRYLKDFAGTTVGLCRQSLFERALPREPHDIPVDIVVTESKITRPL